MLVNPVLLNKLIAELETQERQRHNYFKQIRERLRDAATLEHVAAILKEYLSTDAMNLSIESLPNYFCTLNQSPEEHNPDCKVCEFGKFHGNCKTEDSDMFVLRDTQCLLRNALDQLYYRGESYK